MHSPTALFLLLSLPLASANLCRIIHTESDGSKSIYKGEDGEINEAFDPEATYSNGVLTCSGIYNGPCHHATGAQIKGCQEVQCTTSYACLKISNIPNNGVVNCGGDNSCAAHHSDHAVIEKKPNTNGSGIQVNCIGSLTCDGQEISVGEGHVECAGQQACSSATITAGTVLCSGYNACLSSKIIADCLICADPDACRYYTKFSNDGGATFQTIPAGSQGEFGSCSTNSPTTQQPTKAPNMAPPTKEPTQSPV